MDFIRMNEGVRYRVYNDSQGYKTIGFGLNLDAPGAAELLNSQGIGYRATLNGRVMSPAEAVTLLQLQTENSMDAARRLLEDFESHPKDVQIAVTDLIYNLGPSGFHRLRVVPNLDAGKYDRVASRLRQSRWRRQVGDRADRVISLIEGANGIAMVP